MEWAVDEVGLPFSSAPSHSWLLCSRSLCTPLCFSTTGAGLLLLLLGSCTGECVLGGGAKGKVLLLDARELVGAAVSHGLVRGVMRGSEGARLGSGGWSLMSVCEGGKCVSVRGNACVCI